MMSEEDIKECSRAFTGWNTNDLEFIVNKDQHDTEEKTVLSITGNFDGIDIIDILLKQEAASKFLVRKIYKEFVSEYYAEDTIEELAKIFRENNYEIKPLLRTIFLSKDFYSSNSIGTHIKSPVVLIVNTYNNLEKELASSNIDKKVFVQKSKEYSSIGEIINEAKAYIDFQREKNGLMKLENQSLE